MSFRKALIIGFFVISLAVMAGGCMPSEQLGARPPGNTMEAVEYYLQRYQPGPEPRLFQTTRILDRRGRLIAERWEEGRRTWIPLSKVSPHLINATIATEDVSFYRNTGVDPLRVVGAALQNYEEGEIVGGASTITMQLARNLFLGTNQRYNQTMDRKLLEAGLAQELTTLFSKDELLEMYFNLLNYGHLAYGPEAAAQMYFGKSAADLTLAEATLLAGIPQRPAAYDLFSNLQDAKLRQRTVLDLMVRHGYLNPTQADAVYLEPIRLQPEPENAQPLAPHFVQYLEQSADPRLYAGGALKRSGLTITTTLDLDVQALGERTVAEKVAQLRDKHNLSSAALVAMRPGSGEIMAMVGSADFNNDEIDGQVNVITSRRQPGSAIKPVLYASALNENLISPATVLWDVPVTYTLAVSPATGRPSRLYSPVNYDGKFRGPVTVRTALANSLNVPAVKLLHGYTVERMVEAAAKMGIRSFSPEREYGLSLTLGGGEVTPLELTGAFATLANGGVLTQPNPILAATDALGRDVTPPRAYPPQIVSAATAFQISDILSDNTARKPMFGENSPLKLSRPAAAKTGTTTDFRDNWTVGYTRYLVTGVWAGNANGRPMKGTTGLTGAAPIWHDFMEAVIADPEILAELGAPNDPDAPAAGWEFTPPPDVEQLAECPPGLACREGGEFFSKSWLEAAGDAGPLADSVENAPSAPVYSSRGNWVWSAYCRVEPAVVRTMLKLPGPLGLPQRNLTGQIVAPKLSAEEKTEQMHAMAWSLRHPLPINLGPCDGLPRVAAQALRLDRGLGPAVGQVSADLGAAMNPNVGTAAVGGETLMVAESLSGGGGSSGPARYALDQPVSHHNNCPGNYIMGQVLDWQGRSVAGVQVRLVDQWGNVAETASKDGAGDYGLFDFPLNHFANEYTLTVLDGNGRSVSEPLVIDHLQGAGGDAPCHTVILRGG